AARGLCDGFIRKHQELTSIEPTADSPPRHPCGASVPLFTKLKARQLGGFAALEDLSLKQI
ncbi:hypothetical protein, partial [Pseudomonas peli]|uniref:hypothetical protein n=1 Tax=Pseudomonas peli TaxID=592361 RepID=UPI003D30F2F8